MYNFDKFLEESQRISEKKYGGRHEAVYARFTNLIFKEISNEQMKQNLCVSDKCWLAESEPGLKFAPACHNFKRYLNLKGCKTVSR